MTAKELTQLYGLVSGMVSLVLIFAIPAWVIWWCYLCVSALRNIKLIRLQFERLNDNLEARGTPARTGTFGL